jgi:hypothetical protein
MEVNIFRNTFDRDCTNVVPIIKVLSAIKKGKWAELIAEIREEVDKEKVKQLKENLPAVIFNGVFDERVDLGCVHYNHLMTVDIDNIKSTDLSAIKKRLSENKYIYCFFESPSKGLKVLVPVDSDESLHSTSAFKTVRKMFSDMYGINIDPSGKNLSRLCYVSYDPNLYLNANCEVLHIEETFDSDEFISVNSKDWKISTTDANKIMDRCVKWVKKSKTGSYRPGNRNNYIFHLSCLLSEFGVSDSQALSLIQSKYPSLGAKEIRTTLYSAYKKTRHNFGSKSNFSSNKFQPEML